MQANKTLGIPIALPAFSATQIAEVADTVSELADFQADGELSMMARVCSKTLRKSLVWEELEDGPSYCVEARAPYFALRGTHRLAADAQRKLDSGSWVLPDFTDASSLEVLDDFLTAGMSMLVELCDMSGDWRSPMLHDLYVDDGELSPMAQEVLSIDDLYGTFGIELMMELDFTLDRETGSSDDGGMSP